MCDDNSVELKDLTHRVLSSDVSAHSQSILPLEDMSGTRFEATCGLHIYSLMICI